ncbi:hypothetical protein BT93_L1469 [Corymbia citriodora subsp. variegata]|uniref:Chromatin modification-related protein EAF6 n=1 Tax=Corymbia citriodora subsp. variegata TaxID=360336 RepID=A0A8T0CG48_CORYI|nr:hypothetical protein BT93_L1469 [Corymbia citriodora subsp. variegata]
MAENVAPTVAVTDQPGRPYYENLRTTLRNTLSKKRQLDEQLASLEDQIYKLESSYLEDTSGAGNIVRGFDGWVKGVVVGSDKRAADDKKARARVRDEDRIFSRSSMSWMRVYQPVPPLTTRDSNHATPTSTVSKTTSKKKKAADKDDEDDSKPAKRSKITYGRD